MYIPSAHAVTDLHALHGFIRQHSFATLVTDGEDGLIASHLPILLDSACGPQGTLFGHMARANPQWRQPKGESLAIFTGPHTYISPAWYESDGTVPTWNYVAVHAYGPFQVVDDRDQLLEILRTSVRFFESPRERPWAFDESAPHVDRMLRAIVGFRLEISRLEGKWKLSQNHPEERRQRVIQALETQADPDSQTIASLMRQTTEHPNA